MEFKHPFVFEDHILRMDYSPWVSGKKKPLIRRWRIKLFKERQIKDDAYYQDLKNFFDQMVAGGMCEIGYSGETGYRDGVEIRGSGLVQIVAIADPKFEISPDKKQRTTILPIRIGRDENEIVLFDYPRLELNILPQRLDLDYSFSTRFKLGEFLQFTRRPLRKSKWDSMKKEYEMLFYGKIGKVYARIGDALFSELANSIFTNFRCYKKTDGIRPNFNFGGKLNMHNTNELFYQGNMDFTEMPFPFYINHEEDKSPTDPNSNKTVNPADLIK